MKYKVGDRLLWQGRLTDSTATASFVKYTNEGDTIICNNWSDSTDPEETQGSKTENFRLLTPLEQLL